MGNVKDCLGTEINDGDIVAISAIDKMLVGIYNNKQILTLEDGRINIKNTKGILVIAETPSISEEVSKIRAKYTSDLDKSAVKVIAVNDIKTGTVIETKTGMQWLVMGSGWRLADGHKSSYRQKSGRMFINMKYIDKNISLIDNINNIINECTCVEDMYTYFKFSVPKAIKVDESFSYSSQSIAYFIHNGLIGIYNNNSDYGLIVNGDRQFDMPKSFRYRNIHGLYTCGDGHCVYEAHPFNDTKKLERTIKR